MTEITARLRIATGIVLCAICEASRLRDGLDNEGDARANPEAQRLSTLTRSNHPPPLLTRSLISCSPWTVRG